MRRNRRSKTRAQMGVTVKSTVVVVVVVVKVVVMMMVVEVVVEAWGFGGGASVRLVHDCSFHVLVLNF